MGGTHFLQTGYLLLNRNAPFFDYNDPLRFVEEGFQQKQ